MHFNNLKTKQNNDVMQPQADITGHGKCASFSCHRRAQLSSCAQHHATARSGGITDNSIEFNTGAQAS
jgi:hypothetical protein